MSTGFFDCEVECARLRAELAAAQATNAKLREALKRAGEAVAYESHDDSVGYYVCCQVATYRPHAKGCYIQAALALPTDDSVLQERLAQERERCAKVCEELGMIGHWHYTAAIRSMK